MRATILVENESARPDLAAEHGLSIWLETGEHRIVFDTGDSDAVLANAQTLGIDLASADAIVISHGHHDHAGGLAAVARHAGSAAIYAGRNVNVPKYSRRESGLAEIGIDHQVINAIAHRLRIAQDGQALVPGVTFLADFPDTYPLPADNDRLLVRGEGGMVPDPFDDEIALLVETSIGHVLISGCSHRGIGNIVEKARQHLTDRSGGELVAVIGGFHLHKEDDERVREMADALRSIPQIHAAHCTGDHAVDLLRDILGPAVKRFRGGTVIEIG